MRIKPLNAPSKRVSLSYTPIMGGPAAVGKGDDNRCHQMAGIVRLRQRRTDQQGLPPIW